MDTTTQPTFFRDRNASALRIWHWTFFLFVISTIICVLIAEYMFDTRANAPMVAAEALDRGVELNEKQARGIAHYFPEKLWVLHTWIGYGISILLCCRFLIEVFASKERRLRGKIKHALGLAPATDADKQSRRHYIWVKRGYIVFYLLIFAMAATGLGLAFEDIGIFETYHDPIKQVHELGQWGMYAYVILHISGVFIADATRHNGLVSRMIHGKG